MCSAACLTAANGTITPNEWFAVGSSSAAATAGAARSPLSYTIACGCQARATSRSSGNFEVRMALGEDAPEEVRPPLTLRERLNLRAELFEVRQRLLMRAAGRQRVEALRDDMGMPRCLSGKRQLVPGSSERAGKW